MNLKNLGLSKYEEEAYKALIRLGKSTASKISREGNISYGKIYEVLASLERKGLVKVIPEKTKMFVAEDPQNLMNLINKKEDELKALKKEIASMKQIYETREEEVVHIVKGKRNFYKIIREMKEPKKFKYQIKYTAEYQPEWARQDKKILRKKIDLKTLTRYDKETEKNIKKWLKINPNIKKINNKGIAIDLRESEIIITLIKNNTIISIKDSAFIDLMKTLFINIYVNAEKV